MKNPMRAVHKNHRALAINLLRVAQGKLQTGEYSYVCGALSASAFGSREEQVVTKLRDIIRKSISPHSYVIPWLSNRYPAIYPVNHREYRLKWIDEMIAQLEALPK